MRLKHLLWGKPPESTVPEAKAAIERARRDEELIDSSWPHVRAVRRHADAVWRAQEKIIVENHLSKLVTRDLGEHHQ